MKTTGLSFACQLGEHPAGTFHVTDFSLTEGLSTLFTLALTVVSAQAPFDTDQQLKKPGRFTVYRDGVEQRTVEGIIASMVHLHTGKHQSTYQIILRPRLWLLTLTQDSRIYQHQSVPEILASILREQRIVAQCQFDNPHATRLYTTMKRESYFDFFCRLAAEEGIVFWFEDEGLYYSDARRNMVSGITLPYRPQAELPTEEVINHWQLGAFLCPSETIQKDYNPNNPRFTLIQTQKSEHTGAGSVFESYGRFHKMAEGEKAARYRLEQMRNGSKQGEAQSNCIRLRPGKVFDLEEHPHPAMNDRWMLVTINHHGRQPDADNTRSHEQGTYLANQLTFIPGRQEWRPPYHYKPLADGEELATVVGPEGEEIYVNEEGAVKVHFHWDRYGKPDDNASCWVRVAQGWNGDGFGLLATPRVGQEVIIAYLNGDIDRPIITGTTYNGFNRPPLYLPQEKTRTTLRTKTYKGEGFNELRFDDAKGEEEIYLHAQKNINIDILNQQATSVGKDRLSHIKQHDQLRVEGEKRDEILGDHSLTLGKNQHLRAAGKLLMHAGKEVHLNSGQVLCLSAEKEIILSVGGSFISISAAGVHISPKLDIKPGVPTLGSPAAPLLPAQAVILSQDFMPYQQEKRHTQQGPGQGEPLLENASQTETEPKPKNAGDVPHHSG